MTDIPDRIFYFSILAIIMIIMIMIAWLKKEQFMMAFSKYTFWRSWAGKTLKSLGVIVFTILCIVMIPAAFGAKYDTSIKIAAFLILTEIAYIWKPGKFSLAERTRKADENVDLRSKYKQPLAYRFGKWIAGLREKTK
jgi:hypothetical protein